MKKLLDKLVKKFWKRYERSIIGAGFSWNDENDIKLEINTFLEDFIEKYDFKEYEGDTDDYVKFIVRLEILRMIGKEIVKITSHTYPTPKRFFHTCCLRD